MTSILHARIANRIGIQTPASVSQLNLPADPPTPALTAILRATIGDRCITQAMAMADCRVHPAGLLDRLPCLVEGSGPRLDLDQVQRRQPQDPEAVPDAADGISYRLP